MPRGPYKRYEYDPNAKLPKTTSYNRRKRPYEDIDCEPNSEPTNLNINTVLSDNQSNENSEAESGDDISESNTDNARDRFNYNNEQVFLEKH